VTDGEKDLFKSALVELGWYFNGELWVHHKYGSHRLETAAILELRKYAKQQSALEKKQ